MPGVRVCLLTDIWYKIDQVRPAVREELRRDRYDRLIAAAKPHDSQWMAEMSNLSLPDTHTLKDAPIPLRRMSSQRSIV